MNIVKPYKGLSRDRLTALINEINGNNRVEGVDFTYGIPIAQEGPNGENTRVTLTPVPGTNYEGPQDVYYTRLHLSVVKELPYNVIEPVYLPSLPFWVGDALPEINRALGLDLEYDEIVNEQYTVPQDTYTLTIKENVSLAWIGSIEFEVITEPLTRLEDKVTENQSGFVPELGDLSQAIAAEHLDGFTRVIRDIDELLSDSLDGFERQETHLDEIITSDTPDGFVLTPGPLDTVIQDPLDGFEFKHGVLPDEIENGNPDGFDPAPSELDEAITDPLSGFDPIPAALGSIIHKTIFDGFYPAPHELEEAIDGVLDGFVPTPVQPYPGIVLSSVIRDVYLDGLDMSDSVCVDEFVCTL